MRLLEHAFEGCSRVVVTKLHGGFSGSLVLKTDPYGLNGSCDEPTVTKLDDAKSMLEEVAKTATFTALHGARWYERCKGAAGSVPGGRVW